MAHRVLLLEMAVSEYDAAPSAFPEDICDGAVAAIYADPKVGCEQIGSEGLGVNCAFTRIRPLFCRDQGRERLDCAGADTGDPLQVFDRAVGTAGDDGGGFAGADAGQGGEFFG